MAETLSGPKILKRIDERLAELKEAGKPITDRALSIKATGSADTLRSIRRNIREGRQRGISSQTIGRIARVLGVTVQWLLDEPDAPDDHLESEAILQGADRPTVRTARVVGYVGAGSEAHYYAVSQEDFEEVPAPTGSSDQTVAVEIKGKSFGPLMDSWLVFYDDIRSPVTEDLFNRICVVGLADDRILIKQIKRERDGSFTLMSNSSEPPIHNAQIEWAAKVTDMRPRN